MKFKQYIKEAKLSDKDKEHSEESLEYLNEYYKFLVYDFRKTFPKLFNRPVIEIDSDGDLKFIRLAWAETIDGAYRYPLTWKSNIFSFKGYLRRENATEEELRNLDNEYVKYDFKSKFKDDEGNERDFYILKKLRDWLEKNKEYVKLVIKDTRYMSDSIIKIVIKR